MANRENIKDYIEFFKKYGENENKSLKEKYNRDINSKEFIIECLNAAYQSAKRNCSGIDQNSIKIAFDKISERIREDFFRSDCDFNKLHEDICKEFLNTVKDKNGKKYTYGIAQKVINLTFKYIYCHDDAEIYEKQFSKCHMALDSFILKHYGSSEYKWTQINEDDYNTIKGKIGNGEIKDLTAFQEEFVIWPLLMINERLKSLNSSVEYIK